MYQFWNSGVKIVVPKKNSLFHCLARASESKEYLFKDRDAIADQVRLQLEKALSVKLSSMQAISNDILEKIALYLNIQIEVLNDKGVRDYITPTAANYLVKIYKNVSQYYLIGSLSEDKKMTVKYISEKRT